MFSSTLFGTLPGPIPQDVTLHTLRNRNGMEVELLNYGGIIRALRVPDRLGQLDDIVLGYDTLEEYVSDPHYMGAICGRYANRIAFGRFSIPIGDEEGETFDVGTNLPPHHLHGGESGFHKRVWDSKVIWRDRSQGVLLRLESPDGEGGYPGHLRIEVLFLLFEDNRLQIDYKAQTDRPTPLGLTHHGYFQLDGAGGGGDILNHELTLAADHITPVEQSMIPKGTLHPVERTPFDFRQPKVFGPPLTTKQRDQQLAYGSGYDHNFVLSMEPGELRFVARLAAPASGRMLEVLTTKPGLQLYTANHIGGTKGKGEVVYPTHGAVCLEPQHFPDAPNQPSFPSPILSPGELYRHTTIYRFAIAPSLR